MCTYSEEAEGDDCPLTLTWGLCGSCGLSPSILKELGELSIDSRIEVEKRYNASCAEEAYVIRHYGKPKRDVWYICDTCGKKMNEPAETYRDTKQNRRGSWESVDGHRCSKCHRSFEREVEKERQRMREDEKIKLRSLFGR